MVYFKKIIAPLLLILSLLVAFVPVDNDPLQRLVDSLQKWTNDNPQEKVYLHMDKPYYALGDTIWFKAYITIGSRHELSALSGALYVSLINGSDSVVKELKLPINAGSSIGDFALGDDFKEGHYRIRAYTNWMRNAGEEYFFDHTFIIGNPIAREIISTSNFQYKMINGDSSLIATLSYKDINGAPIDSKKIECNLIINNKVIYNKSFETDNQGKIRIEIPNKLLKLKESYIRTRMKSNISNNNEMISDEFPINVNSVQTDIQFFPEGGSLINNVSSKVAFKATGINGKGMAIKGKLIEDGKTEILEFETLRFGMGSFIMIPKEGKTYSARCIFPDSTEQTIALPQASNDGYALSVYQPNEDSLLVRIRVSPKTIAEISKESQPSLRISPKMIIATSKELKPIYLNLLSHASGEIIAAAPIEMNKPMISVWLEKDAFPSGIAQFTLFSAQGEPLNERIAFVKSKDQMKLKLSSSKTIFKSKEKVEFELNALSKNDEPIDGSFSVSVIDESKLPYEEDMENTIFSNLLLTSDIKGYVERPNYYFNNKNKDADKALDNLMLTQGYRRFKWADIKLDSITMLDPGKAYLTNALFKPEQPGINITGVVKLLSGSGAPRAKLTLMSLKAGIVLSTTADINGLFSFKGLILRDSMQFSLQARTENNGNKVEIVLDEPPQIAISKNKNLGDLNDISATLKVYEESVKKQDAFYEKVGRPNRVQHLKEIRISAAKMKYAGYSTQGSLRIPEGHADNSIDMENEKAGANLGITLRAKVPNVKFTEFTPDPTSPEVIFEYPHYYNPSARKLEPMKIILDGRELRGMEAGGVFNNSTLDPANIIKIDVVLTNAALLAMVGAPSLFIYTKKQKSRIYDPSIINLLPKGFNKVRAFYSPKYESITSKGVSDFRSTIYWNGNLKSTASGKINFNFFNADSPGQYLVIVEGISLEGNLGRAIYRYSLKDL